MQLGQELKKWRKIKKVSQLELALEMGVSSKHISFVETSRSNPSAKLLKKILEYLQIPRAHRAALLNLAGYASYEPQNPSELHENSSKLMQKLVTLQAPNPAVLLDYEYNIIGHNSQFTNLIDALLDSSTLEHFSNMLELIFGSGRLIERFVDADLIGKMFKERLLKEHYMYQSNLLKTYAQRLHVKQKREASLSSESPVFEIKLRFDELELSFFSTVLTVGTPIDATLKDLRIETLHPIDEQTKKWLEANSL